MGLVHTIKTRGLLWLAVHGALFVLDKYIEFVLYPASILNWGLLLGTASMMALSFVLCWSLIVFYDWCATRDTSKIQNPRLRKFVETLTDALGFETLKETGQEFTETLTRPVVITPATTWKGVVANAALRVWEPIRSWIVAPLLRRWFRPIFFVLVSVKYDPMTALILMRPAYKYGMGAAEWRIFVTSVVISCSGWALLVWAALEGMQHFTPGVWAIVEPVINFLS